MTVREVAGIVEQWFPKAVAMEGDNPGLQSGDPSSRVRGVLVSLDPTEAVLREAIRRKRDLVLTHHPLLYRPLRSVDTRSGPGKVLALALRHGIALYAAHTNMDFAAGGTSDALAEALGLRRTSFLRSTGGLQKKIVTFVPATHADRVADALARAGAGTIGNYDRCSFRVEGTGTFWGNDRSSPAIGGRGTLERVREVRLEMVVPSWSVKEAVSMLRAAHPYEEAAFDLYPVDTPHGGFGAGVVGTLPHRVPVRRFVTQVGSVLGSGAVRYVRGSTGSVRVVAVCGGAGTDLLDDALAAGADAFVTADVRYHEFQRAAGRITLADAGHFETEYPVVPALVRRLRGALQGTGLRVDRALTEKNSITSLPSIRSRGYP
jgi:dinuclear metal center YbgI/SA1388 family protein